MFNGARIDDCWDDLKSNELNPDELKDFIIHLNYKKKPKALSLIYGMRIELMIKKKIINILNLDPSKKIVSCYPNVYWDSTYGS